MNFGRFARRSLSGFLRTLSTTYGVEPVRGYWRVREERHQSRFRSNADLTAQTAPHTCVLVSSPHKISILFKEHSHLHGVTTRVLFFRLCTHAVLVNNTRSGSWNAARERMKAVSFCFVCFLEKRNRERGRGTMSGNCGADDMTLCAFFYLSHFWLHEQH